MTTARWQSEAFRDELRTFVSDAVGEPDTFECLRLRPWSTVWKATTGEGTFYAKDNCLGQRHEAATMRRLAALAPDLVVPVIAADPDRGFLLTPDQGEPLSAAGEPLDVEDWSRIVATAGDLQRRVATHVAELDLTVMTPDAAPTYVSRLVAELAALPADDPRRLNLEDRATVEATLPDVVRWADEVAALGLPLTVLHNDLHEANVFATADGLRFFDFGDAVTAEPLAMLRIPVNVVEDALDCGPDDPRLWRIADAALEVWSDLVPLAELRAALPAALQLARLARVESWRRCLDAMDGAELTEYGQAPVRWLTTLAVPPSLSGPSGNQG